MEDRQTNRRESSSDERDLGGNESDQDVLLGKPVWRPGQGNTTVRGKMGVHILSVLVDSA